MFELEVQKYLRNHSNSLESLKEELGINYKKKGDGRVLLKYDQIESPKEKLIVQECRGLILNEFNNWEIIAFSFKRFANYGESWATPIDYKSAKWLEKLDGSLVCLYYWNGAWQVSTSGTPDASGPVHKADGITFAQLFWQTFKELGYRLPVEKFKTYAFELTSPLNRIVIPYEKADLHLLMVRDLMTLEEEADLERFHTWYNWKVVPSHSIDNLEQALESLKDKSGITTEGYVVVDKYFNRIKVKSISYVALAHIKDSFSDRRVAELIRIGEDGEFLNYFPEYKAIFNKFQSAFNKLKQSVNETYQTIKDIEVQKDFALQATKYSFSGALFCVRNGKAKSFEAYFAEMNIENFMQLLNGYMEK